MHDSGESFNPCSEIKGAIGIPKRKAEIPRYWLIGTLDEGRAKIFHRLRGRYIEFFNILTLSPSQLY